MEQLLQNNFLLLYIVALLSVAVMGITVTERMRVALIYGFSFCLAVAGSVPYQIMAVGSTVGLVIVLEFIGGDEKRNALFTTAYAKVKDFLYRLAVELSYAYFVLSLICVYFAPLAAKYTVHGDSLLLFFGLICISRAFLLLSSPRFKTKDITDIIKIFEAKPIHELQVTPHILELFRVLVALEDRNYFIRRDGQHTLLSPSIFGKSFSYIKTHSLWDILTIPFKFFTRGYGTIEMQLIRTIGVEFGYDFKVRRKIFEVFYANMIINGYRNYLRRTGSKFSSQLFREFVIYRYIERVNSKLNMKEYTYALEKKATVLQVFHKENLQQITKEEFYVWCLGLPYYDAIGPYAVQMHSDIMNEFGINQREVMRIVRNLP